MRISTTVKMKEVVNIFTIQVIKIDNMLRNKGKNWKPLLIGHISLQITLKYDSPKRS